MTDGYDRISIYLGKADEIRDRLDALARREGLKNVSAAAKLALVRGLAAGKARSVRVGDPIEAWYPGRGFRSGRIHGIDHTAQFLLTDEDDDDYILGVEAVEDLVWDGAIWTVCDEREWRD